MWANVPAETDFVQLASGDVRMWQRPVDGIVVFPATEQELAVLRALASKSQVKVLSTLAPLWFS